MTKAEDGDWGNRMCPVKSDAKYTTNYYYN